MQVASISPRTLSKNLEDKNEEKKHIQKGRPKQSFSLGTHEGSILGTPKLCVRTGWEASECLALDSTALDQQVVARSTHFP